MTAVRDLFDYEPETGNLRWKYQVDRPRQWNIRYARQVAGTPRKKDGVIQINIFGRMYQAHRLVWEWVFGETPPDEIDHKNGKPWDNRVSNLRMATFSQNRRNSKARGKWPKGVSSPRPGRFVAQIKYGGINHYLGTFSTPEAANLAYKAEAERVFGAFACAGR